MNEGRTVVLTGATRGLGRAMTDEFIRLGHTVLGCGTNEKHVQRLAAAHGEPHDFAVVDVTDDAQVQRWAKRLVAQHGAPDLLINNAALVNENAPLWKIGAAEFDRVIDVNIKGVANVIRHFTPAMIERGRGVIVNFSSGWGRSTSPEVAPYCATKWAMEGLSKALADELPAGLASVPLNPGVINTEMLQSCFGEGANNCIKPEDWAKTAVPFILKLGAKDNGKSVSAP